MRRFLFLAVAPVFAVATARAQVPDSTHTTPPTPGAKSVWQGAYSEDQASRGNNEHSTNCTSCHGTEKYTGDAWNRSWVGRTVFDLYDQLRTTMPDDNPGGLSAQQYKVIVAYILKLNGLPSGTDSLVDDPEAMRLIKIDTKPDKPSSPGTASAASASARHLTLLELASHRSMPFQPTYHARVRPLPTTTR